MASAPDTASPEPRVVHPEPPTPEPRLVRPSLWMFAFPAALLFLALFFVLPLGFFVVRPLVGTYLPWIPVSPGSAFVLTLAFAATWITLFLAFAPEEEGTLREELSQRWWIAMQRRTGISHWDGTGIAICCLGLIACWRLGGIYFVPAFLAGAVGFAGARRTATAAPWPLRHGSRRVTVPPPPTVPASDDAVPVVLEWDYLRLGEQVAFQNRVEIRISRSHVLALAAANPSASGTPAGSLPTMVARLVNEGTTFEVREIARQLIAQAARHQLSVYEEIDNALRMVQSVIEYKDDDDTKGREYWRWPLETLYERAGDCDCKSILAAALLRAVFLLSPESEPREVVLLVSEQEHHAAVAVEGPPGLPTGYLRLGDRSFFFCESTAAGMRVGTIPPNVDLRNYTILRLTPDDEAAMAR